MAHRVSQVNFKLRFQIILLMPVSLQHIIGETGDGSVVGSMVHRIIALSCGGWPFLRAIYQ